MTSAARVTLFYYVLSTLMRLPAVASISYRQMDDRVEPELMRKTECGYGCGRLFHGRCSKGNAKVHERECENNHTNRTYVRCLICETSFEKRDAFRYHVRVAKRKQSRCKDAGCMGKQDISRARDGAKKIFLFLGASVMPWMVQKATAEQLGPRSSSRVSVRSNTNWLMAVRGMTTGSRFKALQRTSAASVLPGTSAD